MTTPLDDRISRRLIAGGLATAALIALAAVVFVNSDQARRISSDARLVRSAEEVVTATMELRANTGISLVIASAEAARLEVEETSGQAIAETRESVENLEAAIGRLRAELGDLAVVDDIGGYADRALAAATTTIDAIAAGDLDVADDTARSALLPSLAALEGTARELSDDAAISIEVEGTAAGRAARAASLVVALILPAVAVLLVRSAVRRRAERTILHTALQAERRSSAARDDLIASLSHQIKTPLAGIYGFAETLHLLSASGTTDNEFTREASIAIFTEAFELRRMVDDLLIVARSVSDQLESGRERIDITRSVEAAAEPFRQTGTQIRTDIESAQVMADHLRLQHALRNLIHNAIRHGAAPVSITGVQAAGAYRLEVRDAGPGLPPGVDVENLFQPYVHRGIEATVTGSIGLGLATAQILVDLMGGSVRYERHDQVTSFEICLEIAADPTTADAIDHADARAV